jgi:hypothetical protein
MPDTMEAPGSEGNPDWDALYLYRGDEVEASRPIFTGDVFFDVEVQNVGGIVQRDVIVLQHPCALRVDGVNLTDSLLVAEVIPDKFYAEDDWRGNYRLMPLPFLSGGVDDPKHYAASFVSLYLVVPASLDPAKRVASMYPLGVNLLLQRWVFHNSRRLMPTWKYSEVTRGPYEEADGIEEWCTIREPKGVSIQDASLEATAWLDDKTDVGIPRGVLLENPQYRPQVRKRMRKHARELPTPPRPPRRGGKQADSGSGSG